MMIRTLTLLCIACAAHLGPRCIAEDLPPVAPVDLAALRPGDFADDELDLPYYLAHFHRLANAVVSEGEDRGFIQLAVWRRKEDNRPHNARIMENCLSLAFFYCTDRPWNPYYRDAALRARLEAALDFWCRIQNDDGQFSEYGPGKWNLAATAFATKFMGETLRLVDQGPPIDADLLERVFAAQRKAVFVVLTDPDLYRHGTNYTNQYANVWGGALALLALRPDAGLATLLRQRLDESMADFQSPAGYFYEAGGPDWSYNLGTHQSDLLAAWHYARGTDLEPLFIEKVQRWDAWLGYNAVREPDGSGFVLNRGVETRQRRPFLLAQATPRSVLEPERSHGYAYLPAAEKVPSARAFSMSRSEHASHVSAARAEWEAAWPKTERLATDFHAYSPYAFLHRAHIHWLPSDAERAEALNGLPYLARDRFNHQRVDSRSPVNFTYIRRPAYYAALNGGPQIRSQQRYGLGLLWTPGTGTLLQSQTASRDAAWGTRAGGKDSVYEAGSLPVAFRAGGRSVDIVPGSRDLPDGDLIASYPLGELGTKWLQFGDEAVQVTVSHAGPLVEQLPLLLGPDDRLEVGKRHATLVRGRGGLRVDLPANASAEVTETDSQVGPYRVAVLRLSARDELAYTLRFLGSASAPER